MPGRSRGSRQTTTVGGNAHVDKIINIAHVEKLVVSLAKTAGDAQVGIANFVVDYLGTASAPTPFGGRANDLAALDRWLEDPAAEPYLLMTARAGAGKSALLVRWSRALAGRDDLAIVFVPVSIRYGTSSASVVFSSLTARLAQVRGGAEAQAADVPDSIRKQQTSTYLAQPMPDGRRLLVVLDGVDEAADWSVGRDLFPAQPPPGLRVVVSARQLANDVGGETWLRRLGWHLPRRARHIELGLLDLAGVREVIRTSAVDAGGGEQVLAEELMRVSAGDPLVIQLHLEEVRRAVAAGDDPLVSLRQRNAGLEAFFTDWWNDQRSLWKTDPAWQVQQRALTAIVGALATARGPLMRADMLDELLAENAVDPLAFDETIALLGRFVIGDGVRHGYVFSHPRLRDYFEEQQTPRERSAWQRRFVHWGERVRQAIENGTRAPHSVPSYVIRYHTTHLALVAGTPEERAGNLHRVISRGWRDAWFAADGGHTGFLNDVDRARSANREVLQAAAARSTPEPRVANDVRYGLCDASVKSVAGGMVPALVAGLVRHNVWSAETALAYLRHQTKDWDLGETLRLLAERLPATLLPQALAEAERIGHARYSIPALLAIAARLPESERAEIAARAVRKSFGMGFGEWAELAAQALALIPARDRDQLFREALTAARRLKPTLLRCSALLHLEGVATGAARTQIVGEVLAAVQRNGTIRSYEELTADRPRTDATAHNWVYTHLLGQLAPHVSDRLLDSLVAAARLLDPGNSEDISALGAIDAARPDLDLREEIVRRIRPRKEWSRIWATVHAGRLGHELPRDVVDGTFAALPSRKEGFFVARGLEELAPFFPPDVIERCIDRARAIEETQDRSRALAALAGHSAPESARGLFMEALDAAHFLNDRSVQERTIGVVAFAILQLGEFESAMERVAELRLPKIRADALTQFMAASPPRQPKRVLDAALSAIDDIHPSVWRIDALSELLVRTPPFLQPEVKRRLLDQWRRSERRFLMWPGHGLLAAVPVIGPAAIDESEATLDPETLAAMSARASGSEAERLLNRAVEAATANDAPGVALHELAGILAYAPHRRHGDIARRAIEIALNGLLDSENLLANSIAWIAPYMNAVLQRQALDVIWAMEEKYDQLIALTALIPHLTRRHRRAVLRRVRSLTDPGMVFAALSAFLPGEEAAARASLFTAASAARRESAPGVDGVNVDALAAALPSPFSWIAAPAAVAAASDEHEILEQPSRRTQLARLRDLMPPEVRLVAGPFVSELLGYLARRPRNEFLQDVAALAPLIGACGGVPALEQTAAAINDVGPWWP